jgi:hypothetical protein
MLELMLGVEVPKRLIHQTVAAASKDRGHWMAVQLQRSCTVWPAAVDLLLTAAGGCC